VFIVGADITEFGKNFEKPRKRSPSGDQANQVFNARWKICRALGDRHHGIALGGGFEMALSTDYPRMSTAAQVGFPGSQARHLSRLRRHRAAAAPGRRRTTPSSWIAGGDQQKPDAALKVHAVDAVVRADKLKAAAVEGPGAGHEGSTTGRRDAHRRKGRSALADGIDDGLRDRQGFIAGKAGKASRRRWKR